MQQYKCLIVEDEPLAAEVLEEYVGQVPFLLLADKCSDAFFAMEILQRQTIDLLLLDIHLPGLKGLDLLRTLKNPPQVIITTAYPDYALQGFELNVIDYLLKPIEFSRFLTAVNKLRFENRPDPPGSPRPSPERPHIFISVGKKKVKVYFDEILYIESLREYIRISAKNRTILTKFPLGQMEELLRKNNFLRIHRSFIVSKDKIEAFTATDIEIDGKQIPIGRSYRDDVIAALQ